MPYGTPQEIPSSLSFLSFKNYKSKVFYESLIFNIYIYFFLIGGKLPFNVAMGFCCTMQHSHNYIYIYIYRLPLKPPSTPPSHHYRSSQSAKLGSLCYTATSHQLSVSHMIENICRCYFLHSSHSLLWPLCPQSVLYICVSIPSLQIGSSIPLFLDSINMH